MIYHVLWLKEYPKALWCCTSNLVLKTSTVQSEKNKGNRRALTLKLWHFCPRSPRLFDTIRKHISTTINGYLFNAQINLLHSGTSACYLELDHNRL